MSQYKDLINKYSQTKPVSNEDLLKHQKGLLFLLGEIVEACDKYGLKPFVIGGNLIGKVRHGGFIPWDDDLDLGMLREDYNKFIDVYEKELSDRYVISAPFKGYNATNRFIQVGRKGTSLKVWGDGSDKNVTSYVYIDIFPFDYAPTNSILRFFKGTYCNLLMSIAGSVSFEKERTSSSMSIFKHSLKGRLELFIRIFLGKLFGFKSVSAWMRIVNNSVENTKYSKLITSAVDSNHYFGGLTETNKILPLERSEYCGVSIYQISNPDAYLTAFYGDYMQVPQEEKRESHLVESIFIPDEML